MRFKEYNASSPVIQKIVMKNLLALGQDIKLRILDRVKKEEKPSGEPFKRLAKSTIAMKRDAGKQQMLRWTGQMLNSINSSVKGNSLFVGIADAKGKKHQLGIGVPARPILDTEGEDKVEQGIIQDQLQDMAKEMAEYVVFNKKRSGI